MYLSVILVLAAMLTWNGYKYVWKQLASITIGTHDLRWQHFLTALFTEQQSPQEVLNCYLHTADDALCVTKAWCNVLYIFNVISLFWSLFHKLRGAKPALGLRKGSEIATPWTYGCNCSCIPHFHDSVSGSGHETVAVLLPGFAINW